MHTLEQKIFNIRSEEEFTHVALEVYDYQVTHCEIYRKYVQQLHWPDPARVEEIPFLPISFFKSHVVQSDEKQTKLVFKSSGTGGSRSEHHVADPLMYETAFTHTYRNYLGPPEDQVILALLPNYIEQGDSSLIYMVDRLIQQTNNPLSGFFPDEHSKLVERYEEAIQQEKKVVIFGVSYALLDLCLLTPDLHQAIIIETGGMKGRRKELTKAELHEQLSTGLNCKNIRSEYGMTELLSQGYSNEKMLFQFAPWMQYRIREVNDPFSYITSEKTGGINLIDLANLYSCSFIATQDLGRHKPGGLEIMGRFDHSDIRGCNLLVQ